MEKNEKLGRGFEALFGQFDFADDEKFVPRGTISKQEKAPETQNVPRGTFEPQEVDILLIDNNTRQPRKRFDEEKLNELAESIREHGVFQPILLKKVGVRYMIVAGERRFRAARIAGLKSIPAIVKDFTERQIAEVAIVENLQRQDLNEVELARGIRQLMEDYELTQEQVSLRLGKNRSSVANTLRILNFPQEIQEMIIADKLTMGHVKALGALTDRAEQVRLAKDVFEKGLSVRALEFMIAMKNSTKSKKPKLVDLELKEFEKVLKKSLATKVQINGDTEHGKIIIDYYTRDDLDRIGEILNRFSKK
ncbi:MAG: ParB/RepB/Spo0J family partition protein [Christensenellaceae bacterium]|nr:ParB/RepB/Spo0J family partition protein [Christensenellaceae bacterium]